MMALLKKLEEFFLSEATYKKRIIFKLYE